MLDFNILAHKGGSGRKVAIRIAETVHKVFGFLCEQIFSRICHCQIMSESSREFLFSGFGHEVGSLYTDILSDELVVRMTGGQTN
jgi:hypothetical protein